MALSGVFFFIMTIVVEVSHVTDSCIFSALREWDYNMCRTSEWILAVTTVAADEIGNNHLGVYK